MSTKYIPAGAGSGKTYTLTNMLADLLVPDGGGQAVNPSRIILTTFTKSAAADFVRRAREVLIDKKGSPAMAAGLDSALIGTVHSVCERFVKKYWYRLDLNLPLNTLSNEDRALFMSRTSENTAGDDDVKFFAQFANDFEMDPEFWKDYMKLIVEKKHNFGVATLSASRKYSCDVIDKVFTKVSTPGEKDAMIDLVDRVLSLVNADLASKPNETGFKRREALEEMKRESDFLRAREICKMIDLDKGSVYTKGYWSKLEPVVDLVGIADVADNYLVSKEIGTRMKDCVNKLFDLAGKWEEEYNAFKIENRLIDFNDMEQKFLRLLEEDCFQDVREDISKSYDVMMVDEFQDSNPVQIRIFRHLMELVKDTVFVGDHKQAIYGFRGTESSLVDDFIKDIKDQQALKKSFRSRPELVNTANDVFCRAFWVDDSLEPVRPYHKDMQPALQHWNTPVEGSGVKNNYDAVGKKIRELVDSKECLVVTGKDKDGNEIKKPIRFGDIALLIRNNETIADAVTSLRMAGVPVSVQEKEFIGWAEVQLILSLVRFVFNAEDKCAKADILRLIEGMTTEEIIREQVSEFRKEKVQALFKKLADIRSRISVLSVSEIVESLALELDLYGLVKDWGLPDTRTRNIEFMIDLARKYEDRCVNMNLAPTLPGYLAYAAEYKPETHPVDKADTVKVLTYHSSKGLDWPMVILDELDSLKVGDEDVFRKGFSRVSNVRVGGEVLLRVFPRWRDSSSFAKLPQSVLSKLVLAELLEPERKRKIDEERRLLYVGFTRAKDYLVTLGNQNSTYSWLRLCKVGDIPSKVYDLTLPENTEEKVDRPLRTWRVPEEKDFGPKYQSPSLADHKADVPVTLSEGDLRGARMEQDIPKGMSDVCGTCIHRIFAAYDLDADRKEMEDMAGRIISGMGLEKAFPSPASVIQSAEQFFVWLRNTYGPGTALHELPFMLRKNDGTVVRGEMDLVWELPGKECVLVDYKSYHDIEDMDDPEARDKYYGYASQLIPYKDTLEAGGYTVRDVLIYYFVQGRVILFR